LSEWRLSTTLRKFGSQFSMAGGAAAVGSVGFTNREVTKALDMLATMKADAEIKLARMRIRDAAMVRT